MNYNLQRELLCKICKLLFDRGLVAGTDGNISMRLGENHMLITPSGVCKGFLEEKMLLVQAFDGHVVEGTLRPTKEAALHIAYYHARKDVGAIIHTHPPYTTGFAACGEPVPMNVVIELPALIGKTAVAAYAPPGSEELVTEVQSCTHSNVILLKNHGVITVGSDLIEAFVRMDMLENAAKTIVNARILGTVSPIPQSEVDKML